MFKFLDKTPRRLIICSILAIVSGMYIDMAMEMIFIFMLSVISAVFAIVCTTVLLLTFNEPKLNKWLEENDRLHKYLFYSSYVMVVHMICLGLGSTTLILFQKEMNPLLIQASVTLNICVFLYALLDSLDVYKIMRNLIKFHREGLIK